MPKNENEKTDMKLFSRFALFTVQCAHALTVAEVHTELAPKLETLLTQECADSRGVASLITTCLESQDVSSLIVNLSNLSRLTGDSCDDPSPAINALGQVFSHLTACDREMVRDAVMTMLHQPWTRLWQVEASQCIHQIDENMDFSVNTENIISVLKVAIPVDLLKLYLA